MELWLDVVLNFRYQMLDVCISFNLEPVVVIELKLRFASKCSWQLKLRSRQDL